MKEALEKIYEAYMENDTQGLLSDEFDYMIDDMKKQGLIKEEAGIKEERDDLINIVGNIAQDVETIEQTNNQGEKFKVVNFSVVSNDEEGKKIYQNCSAYEDKAKIPENFQKGDFVKLFGQVRKSIDVNGKEHTNVRILDSKLLKAKEKVKGQVEKKESILVAIKKHKEADKQKDSKKSEKNMKHRDNYMAVWSSDCTVFFYAQSSQKETNIWYNGNNVSYKLKGWGLLC